MMRMMDEDELVLLPVAVFVELDWMEYSVIVIAVIVVVVLAILLVVLCSVLVLVGAEVPQQQQV